VPPQWPSERSPARIVVGVDGSPESARALRWALDEAELWGSALVVVHSWYTPYPVEPWGMVLTPRDRNVFQQEAHDLINDMVKLAVADGATRPPQLTVTSIEDASGPALVHASADADLLVVGSRGRGGFKALLLGSTSLHCLHHATCPVVVVPPHV
jgi:nucleotide-binding universal stress UspA family protein